MIGEKLFLEQEYLGDWKNNKDRVRSFLVTLPKCYPYYNNALSLVTPLAHRLATSLFELYKSWDYKEAHSVKSHFFSSGAFENCRPPARAAVGNASEKFLIEFKSLLLEGHGDTSNSYAQPNFCAAICTNTCIALPENSASLEGTSSNKSD